MPRPSTASSHACSPARRSRVHTIQINGGPEASGHYDAVIVAFTLRVVLAQFGR